MFERKTIPAVLGMAALAVVAAQAATRATAQNPQAAQVGTYTLVSVGGSALPLVVDEEDGCREELLAATLTLSQNGVWTLVGTERETCGAAIENEEEREEGRFVVDGQSIRFTDEDGESDDADDGDDASDDDEDAEREIDDLSVGSIGTAGLTVRLRDGRTDLVFRR